MVLFIGKGVFVFVVVVLGDIEKELNIIVLKVFKMKFWDDEFGGRV